MIISRNKFYVEEGGLCRFPFPKIADSVYCFSKKIDNEENDLCDISKGDEILLALLEYDKEVINNIEEMVTKKLNKYKFVFLYEFYSGDKMNIIAFGRNEGYISKEKDIF